MSDQPMRDRRRAAQEHLAEQGRRMASALERGMPTALAAQAVYGTPGSHHGPIPAGLEQTNPELAANVAPDDPYRPRAHRDAAGVLWVPVEVDGACWEQCPHRHASEAQHVVDCGGPS